MSAFLEVGSSLATAYMAAVAFIADISGANPLLIGTWLRRWSVGRGMPEEKEIFLTFWIDADPDKVYKAAIHLKINRTLSRKKDHYWSVIGGQGALLVQNSAVQFFTITDDRKMVTHGELVVRQKDIVW